MPIKIDLAWPSLLRSFLDPRTETGRSKHCGSRYSLHVGIQSRSFRWEWDLAHPKKKLRDTDQNHFTGIVKGKNNMCNIHTCIHTSRFFIIVIIVIHFRSCTCTHDWLSGRANNRRGSNLLLKMVYYRPITSVCTSTQKAYIIGLNTYCWLITFYVA